MSSVQHLREFIRERLTAAAEEIFSEVEKTIARHEEEHRIMVINWKPQIKLSRIDIQKPHVSSEKEASAIHKLCNQGRRSGHDQEVAEHQWTEEEQMEPDPPLVYRQGETGSPCVKEEEEDLEPPLLEEENGKPGHSGAKEEHIEPEPPVIEEQEEPEPPLIEEQEEPEPSLIEEQEEPEPSLIEEQEGPEPPLIEEQEESECLLMVEDEDLDSSRLKPEQQVPKHFPTRQDQNLHSCQEGEQLVQKRSVALMETSTLEEGDLSEGEPRLFSCKTCGKSFKRRCHLTLHQKIHTGEKPFSCKTCGKRFSRRNVLKVHQRTHTSGRPFSCPTCGESFSQIGHLNIHKKVHKDERTFSCKTCGKGFSRRGELNIHQRSHIVGGPCSCEICGESYCDVVDLNFHVGQKHKVIIDWSQPWI